VCFPVDVGNGSEQMILPCLFTMDCNNVSVGGAPPLPTNCPSGYEPVLRSDMRGGCAKEVIDAK